MHVWSIGPDGHEYAVKDNEMAEVSLRRGSTVLRRHRRVANPPGRDPGGIVAYEYEQRCHPYLTETTGSSRAISRLNQSFTLELPAGFTYGTVWAHTQGPAIDLEHQRWRWVMNDEPGHRPRARRCHPPPIRSRAA